MSVFEKIQITPNVLHIYKLFLMSQKQIVKILKQATEVNKSVMILPINLTKLNNLSLLFVNP